MAGYGNTAGATASFIGAGAGNKTTGPGNFIGAGGYAFSSVGGIDNVPNFTSGLSSAIVAGWGNTATGNYNFIGAGGNNITSGDHSCIVAGQYNNISDYRASIVGGAFNTITHNHSFIGGGELNTVNATHSVALGKNATVTTGHNNSFVFAGSTGMTSMASNSFTVGADLYYPGHGATSGAILVSNNSGLATWSINTITSGTWTPVLGSESKVIVVGSTGSVSQDSDDTNTGTYMRIGNIIQFSSVYYLKFNGSSSCSSIDLTSNLPIGRTGPMKMAGLVGTYILFDVPLENINQQVVAFRYFNPSTITDNYSIKIASNTGYSPGITNGISIGDGTPFTVFVNGQYTLV